MSFLEMSYNKGNAALRNYYADQNPNHIPSYGVSNINPYVDPQNVNMDPPPRMEDSEYDSSLVVASRNGDLAEVKRLLAEGVDPTLNHNAAIFEATDSNHPDVVLELLKDDRVDVMEDFDDPEYPYHPNLDYGVFLGWVKKGNLEVVRALLNHKSVKPDYHRKVAYLENLQMHRVLQC